MTDKRLLVDPQHPRISIQRQCELLGIHRSGYYYQPCPQSEENLRYMRLIDEQYLRTPFFGSRQMTRYLRAQGHPVNRKRIQRLMRLMGLRGAAPGPHTSRAHPEHKIYPYLLEGVKLTQPNLVWSTDLTYIPLATGFMYLVAIIDWYTSRVQEYPVQGACIVVDSKAQKRRHSGATLSFCNAAIGEKTRAMNGVFLIARSIQPLRVGLGTLQHHGCRPLR